jgi:ABC-2 type transport system permease protein
MSPKFWQRTYSVSRKELLHIVRDPMTLFSTLFVPVLQLLLLGYAIDTNVRNVPTAVVDHANTQESRALLKRFENSKDFAVVARVATDAELNRAIVAGKARVGIKIPEDYSRQLEAGQTAQVLVLVDGTESSVAAEAINVSNSIALSESLERALGGRELPVEVRPRVLFNPDTRSANYFIPGLMVVVCQMMASLLAANAIVREKEMGTLEQMYMTPVRPVELILGKMLPYLLLTGLEFCFIALLMRTAFGVPIQGAFTTLLALAVPFVLGMLGLGLWISTRASTRDAAMQITMGTVLPSVFLSGYIFPIESMPTLFQYVAKVIPATWLIDASRGVVLRGAGWAELWVNSLWLWGLALAMIGLAVSRFRKRVA